MKLFKLFYYIITLLLINVINTEDENIDANWMKYISDNKYINQINIPGTHDSGTYDIGKLFNNNIVDGLFQQLLIVPWVFMSHISEYAKTQDMDITEQLESGIRYLDVRLASVNTTIDNDINYLYLSHGSGKLCIPCINLKTNHNLYLVDVLNECINFLIKHPKETILIHLKNENILSDEIKSNLGSIIANYTFLNTTINTNTKNSYNNFYYLDNNIPKLNDTRGKILFITRDKLTYNNNKQLGIQIPIPGMGDCENLYLNDNIDYECLPKLSGKNLEYRIQDAYNLNAPNKWELVNKVIKNEISSTYEYKLDNITYIGTSHKPLNDYYLTINFMNVARSESLLLDAGKASIEQSANYINTRLTELIIEDLKNKLNNEWIIMDYPNPDTVRAIYQSNDPNHPELNKNKAEVDSWFGFAWTDIKYYVSKTPFDTIFDFFESIFKRNENNNVFTCLQRNYKNDKITTNSKCTKGSKSQWYFKPNDKYFNIISAYDNKCLVFQNEKLIVKDCDKSNKYEDFIIKNSTICSRIDSKKCLDGKYNIYSSPLESKQYSNSTCSSTYIKHGYNCCTKCVNIDHEDDIGIWGFENGDWCGIPFECLGEESSSEESSSDDEKSDDNKEELDSSDVKAIDEEDDDDTPELVEDTDSIDDEL